MADPVQLMAEFRAALKSHLHEFYGYRDTPSDLAPPSSDDHHLIAFATGASAYHPQFGDPCAAVRAQLQQLQAAYKDMKEPFEKEFDPELKKWLPAPKPTEKQQQALDAKASEIKKKKAELTACEAAFADPCAKLRVVVQQLRDQYDDMKEPFKKEFDPELKKWLPAKKPTDEQQAALDAKLEQIHDAQHEVESCEAARPTSQRQICYEVHQDKGTISYWICVPHPTAPTYLWYQLRRTKDGSFEPVSHPKLDSTPYPFWAWRPVLSGSRDWTGGGSYNGALPSVDPPHWSPVLVMGYHMEKHKKHHPHPAKAPGMHESEWVVVANPPDAAVSKKLHNLMAAPSGTQPGSDMIDAARPVGEDLTNRVARNCWPPVTARGLATHADLSGDDFSGDHATTYVEDPDPAATGFKPSDAVALAMLGPEGLMLGSSIVFNEYMAGNVQVSDRSWPGMDWDISLTTDPDVAYLSSESRPNELQIEIEQFDLENDYRPQTGEWIQATGRWIMDCGHEDDYHHFYTEIHPPELLVSSHVVAGESTEARVTTTGAWQGTPLTFVVFPPPRPTATSALQTSVSVSGRLNAGLTWEPWPPENPNHVVFRIDPEGDIGLSRIWRLETGMVGMSRFRFLRAKIWCHWAEQTAFLKASASGAGARVYFRDPDLAPSLWTELPPWGVALRPISYLLRGAGSGWNYGPKELTLSPGANSFVLSPDSTESYPPDVAHPQPAGLRRVRRPNNFDTHQNLVDAAWGTLSETLLVWTPPGSKLISARDRLSPAYREYAVFVVHLLSFIHADGQPFTDLESAVKDPFHTTGGAEGFPDIQTLDSTQMIAAYLHGASGPGVAQAKLRAYLRLGNDQVGHHIIDTTDAVTDAGGAAALMVQAGTHAEDVSVMLEVIENPVNTWFTPTVISPSVFFLPGIGADSPSPGAYGISVPPPRQLTTLSLNLSALSRAVDRRAVRGFRGGFAILRHP